MNYSNTAVMHAQKLEIHRQNHFMSRKYLDNEQNTEQNRSEKKIAGKKNRWKKSKIGSALV